MGRVARGEGGGGGRKRRGDYIKRPYKRQKVFCKMFFSVFGAV